MRDHDDFGGLHRDLWPELPARFGVSHPRLNELIHGKRGVTPDTALRLARVLNMSADL